MMYVPYRAVFISKLIGLVIVVLSACSTLDTIDARQVEEQHEVPNCILPGQVRKLGNRTVIAPRQAVATTAADCNDRGGDLLAGVD